MNDFALAATLHERFVGVCHASTDGKRRAADAVSASNGGVYDLCGYASDSHVEANLGTLKRRQICSVRSRFIDMASSVK